MNNYNVGDRAAIVFMEALSKAKKLRLKFVTYNLNKSGKNKEAFVTIPLDVDEMDGSWNWIYVGYSHTK